MSAPPQSLDEFLTNDSADKTHAENLVKHFESINSNKDTTINSNSNSSSINNNNHIQELRNADVISQPSQLSTKVVFDRNGSRNNKSPLVVNVGTATIGSTNVGTLPASSLLIQNRSSPIPKTSTVMTFSSGKPVASIGKTLNSTGIQIVTVPSSSNTITRNVTLANVSTNQRVLAPRNISTPPIRIAPQTRHPGGQQIVLPQQLGQVIKMGQPGQQWVLVQNDQVQRPINANTIRPFQGNPMHLQSGRTQMGIRQNTNRFAPTNQQVSTSPIIMQQHHRPVTALLKTNTTTIRPTIRNQGVSQIQQDNMKKCKNFLQTLLKLASNQPESTVTNVKQLIQSLIDGQMKAEDFTQRLQSELKSSPQPYLVPFLNKSLPLLRNAMVTQNMVIDGIRPPKMYSTQSSTTPKIIRTNVVGGSIEKVSAMSAIMKQMPSTSTPTILTNPNRIKSKYETSKDDDEFNDVATMGGVNLSEESKNLASSTDLGILRSYKDETLLVQPSLQSYLQSILRKQNMDIEQDTNEISKLISHACQLRLTELIEKLVVLSEHRMELYRGQPNLEMISDVRSQLRFIEDVDRVEKKRHDEVEREQMLRAAKSRSKNEDPEQVKLKQKAKEFQQAQAEEIRQKEANATALAAIGSRKRKLESEIISSTSGVIGGSTVNTIAVDSPSNIQNSPGQNRIANIQHSKAQILSRNRKKRVTAREVVHMMEEDKHLSKSKLLYKTALKQ